MRSKQLAGVACLHADRAEKDETRIKFRFRDPDAGAFARGGELGGAHVGAATQQIGWHADRDPLWRRRYSRRPPQQGVDGAGRTPEQHAQRILRFLPVGLIFWDLRERALEQRARLRHVEL